MGTTNSTPIAGGGTEGYHVLKVIKCFKIVYLNNLIVSYLHLIV